MKNRGRKAGNSLSRQLLIHAVIPAAVSMGLVAVLILYLVSDKMTEFLEREVQDHSRLVCESLDRHFEKYIQLVGQGKYNRELQNYLKEVEDKEQVYSNENSEDIQRILNSLLGTQEDNALRGTTWIADVDANILLEDDRSGAFLTKEDGWNLVDRPWAKKAFYEEDVFITSPYRTKTENILVISIICPVRDWEIHQLLGVFGIDVRLDSLEEIMKIDSLDYQNKIVLLDEEGIVLYHEDEEQLLKNYKELEVTSVIMEAREERQGDTYQYTCANQRLLGCIMKAEGISWTIVSAIPMERIDAVIRKMIGPVLLLLLISIFFEIFYVTVILQRRVIEPLKKVEAAAIDISQGKLDFELQVRSGQEIEQIAKTLNEDVKELFCKLKEKDYHITESMEYARILRKRITNVPSGDSRVWFEYGYALHPAELVGGDFLWGKVVDEGVLLALGDCTGHGVPGALLSVMVVSILRGIVETMEISQLDMILWKLDRMLYENLNTEKQPRSFDVVAGVDMGLLLIRKDKSFSFAGANQQLYLENHEVVETIRGERLMIGEGKALGPQSFTIHTFEKQDGVSGYLVTDGLFEQPGGDRRLPFGYNRMKRILVKYKEEAIDKIINRVLEEYEDYKGKEGQRDDVTIFGFRL